MIHKFYKDNEGWFIDLPEFLEAGLGTKGNLAMVLGADTFLDRLTSLFSTTGGYHKDNEVTLQLDENEFDGYDGIFDNLGFDQPTEELEAVGHPIQMGGYYIETKLRHQIWLCPVTIYVFGGHYPKRIYYRVL